MVVGGFYLLMVAGKLFFLLPLVVVGVYLPIEAVKLYCLPMVAERVYLSVVAVKLH